MEQAAMTGEQLEVFKSIFAAQRAIGKAQLSSRQAVRPRSMPTTPRRPPKYAATLREHCTPPGRDWAGIAIAAVGVLTTLAAYLIAMTGDFWSLP